MLNLIPALRVKDTTVMSLLRQEFYYGDFVFFPHLAVHLGRLAALPVQTAQKVGVLSALIYLSSKIHFAVQEQAETAQEMCTGVQMPVLLGDLLYGQFLRYLADQALEDYLPVYLTYLQQFNDRQVTDLQTGQSAESAEFYIQLLAEKTATVIGMLAGFGPDERQALEKAADQYLQMQWACLRGAPIEDIAVLEEKLQAELL